MVALLGGMVASYFLYIVIALIFKHKFAFIFMIATSILMIISSIFMGVDFLFTAISCICVALLTHFVKFFRVRDNKKTPQVTSSDNNQTQECTEVKESEQNPHKNY